MLPPMKKPLAESQRQERHSERRLDPAFASQAGMLTGRVDLRDDGDIELEDLIAEREAWKQTGWATLVLAYSALGVVYGDLGTSPLYTYPGIFSGFETDPTTQDILGSVSLIFWSITLIVLVKYVFIVLRADDQGEGGTFALYTRLCRIIGVTDGGLKPMSEQEQAEVAQVAATAEQLHKASRSSLARATRDLPRALSALSKMSRSKPSKPSDLERELAGGPSRAGSGAARAGSFSPMQAPPSQSRTFADYLKNELVHKAAFPAEPVRRFFRRSPTARAALLAISVLSISMVVGDGVLTPAISVVSAVQGLTLKTDITQEGIVGISSGILIGLFLMQRLGTQSVSFVFSPIMGVWLLSVFAVGVYNLSVYGAEVLKGLNPYYIATFFNDHGGKAWEALGGVMLCLTGVEAMFADLGHVSVGAIRYSFCLFVYPCIVLAYLGQGAYLIRNPGDSSNAFYASVPEPFFWPQLIIATLAAIVASQALITGAFSIIRQAISLELFPPLRVLHTGKHVEGQVYISTVNYLLMVLSIAVVAVFNGNSTQIGHAFGIAMSFVMILTTGLMLLVMLVDWELSAFLLVPFGVVFLTMEGGYLSACLLKVPQGGWFALLLSALVVAVQCVWMSGHAAKRRYIQQAKHTTAADIAEILTVVPCSRNNNDNNNNKCNSHSDDSKVSKDRRDSKTPGSKTLVTQSTPATGRSAGWHPNAEPERYGRSIRRCSLATRSRPLGSDLQPSALGSTVVEIEAQSRGTALPVVPEETHSGGTGQRGEQDTESPKDATGSGGAGGMLLSCDVGLARLRGIGIFYTHSQQGMPAVMWHFLRNVEAVHEVVILLEIQFLPIPHLNSLPGAKELQRFSSCRPVEGLPHFYRVSARYGYMDVVDHGPEFVASVKERIEADIMDAAIGAGPLKAALPTPAAALEERQLLEAAYAQGVVHYLGRSRIRMKGLRSPLVQVLHDLWYGELYRTLAINCWDRVESWRIPFKSMVEIGIVVEI